MRTESPGTRVTWREAGRANQERGGERGGGRAPSHPLTPFGRRRKWSDCDNSDLFSLSLGCRTVAERRRHTNLKQRGSTDPIGLGADDFFFCVRGGGQDSDLGRIRHALGKDKGTFETVRRLRKQSVPRRKRTCCTAAAEMLIDRCPREDTRDRKPSMKIFPLPSPVLSASDLKVVLRVRCQTRHRAC
ncbi:hypothetical protein CDAR_395961 [Caerostris darwini]|uniref:Uncharacterized protein n=1 Tax=Caerostris darwini TaxID=1538125 RepID=A0AAV4WNX7_9ARAC|nr:hypothetical protein CDAR_395961 [Caerostris darwini]